MRGGGGTTMWIIGCMWFHHTCPLAILGCVVFTALLHYLVKWKNPGQCTNCCENQGSITFNSQLAHFINMPTYPVGFTTFYFWLRTTRSPPDSMSHNLLPSWRILYFLGSTRVTKMEREWPMNKYTLRMLWMYIFYPPTRGPYIIRALKGGGVPCYMLYGFSMGLLYAI